MNALVPPEELDGLPSSAFVRNSGQLRARHVSRSYAQLKLLFYEATRLQVFRRTIGGQNRSILA